ncbi:MAG: hypothetical protein QNJ46_15420 [Leptolyngbyaceae cyanobacterium MO_188.B28]|nr:hypothetical protein [Leptolyngbyaceae cyanobacterium MO_188.B28]
MSVSQETVSKQNSQVSNQNIGGVEGAIQPKSPFHKIPRKVKTHLKRLSCLGLGASLAAIAVLTGPVPGKRYGPDALADISIMTEPVENHQWVGEGLSFQQQRGAQFDIVLTLTHASQSAQLRMPNVDLKLFIPKSPETAQGNPDLTRWFLTEREFNRQQVIFEVGSESSQWPEGFSGYNAEDLSIALTNNCLGAGYWEVAVFAQTENGDNETIYQGYFNFPRGAYASLIAQLNPTKYWRQARNLENWPGFRFLSGMAFDLDALRQVNQEQAAPVLDLATESIIAVDEQVEKADLVVYAENTSAQNINTWGDLRQANLKFQSFLHPGVYNPNRLWESDYDQIANVTGATVRQISSPLSNQDLREVEIEFANTDGETRKFIISGFDLEQIPQLESSQYADGVYMPLGFAPPFTQDYADLVQHPPDQSPFFSVWLTDDNRVIDYRKDIGVNGVVLHRDAQDDTLLHVYIMSYERITLVGHYVIDLYSL